MTTAPDNDDAQKALVTTTDAQREGVKVAKKQRRVPLAKRTAELRKAMLHSISPVELAVLFRMVLHQATEEGDLAAAKLIIEYLVGKPVESDLLERLEELEQMIADSARGY